MSTEREIDIEHLLALLRQHRFNLEHLLLQQALHGKANTPLPIINGIVTERENIRRVKADLRKYGMTVADLAIDDAEGIPDIDLRRFNAYPQYRGALIDQMKTFWIQGVLENSIYRKALVEAGVEYHPSYTKPWQTILERPEYDLQTLPRDVRMINVFEQFGTGRRLLIKGEKGSGKTALLLELARDLVDRTERNVLEPIPVVLSLPSWTDTPSQSIADWITNELEELYRVPRNVGQTLIDHNLILPLLDDFDEVSEGYMQYCADAIASFIRDHNAKIAICSNQPNYRDLAMLWKIRNKVILQPIQQHLIDESLSVAGETLIPLKNAIRTQHNLYEAAKLPLMLSIMALIYQKRNNYVLPTSASINIINNHVMRKYIEYTFMKHSTLMQSYNVDDVREWLRWLAGHMAYDCKTTFLPDKIPHHWLTPSEWAEYIFGLRIARVLNGVTLSLPIVAVIFIASGFISILAIGVLIIVMLGLISSFFNIQLDRIVEQTTSNIVRKTPMRPELQNTVRTALGRGTRFLVTLFSGVAIATSVQRVVLRIVLYRNRRMPLRIAHFLSCVVAVGLMKQIGEGYIFIHQLIMEYLVNTSKTD